MSETNKKTPTLHDLIKTYLEANLELQPCVVIYNTGNPALMKELGIPFSDGIGAEVLIIPQMNAREASHLCNSIDQELTHAEAWDCGKCLTENT